MKIGIDFDNTIARYDKSFLKLAHKYKYINKNQNFFKKDQLKNFLFQEKNGEKKWMKIQGQAYGKFMNYAELFPSVINFFLLSYLRKHKIFIISHRTEYGHFDEEKFLLRNEAIKWMRKKNFFKKNGINFSINNIFFANTREEKIKIISELKCDYFIDDLIPVLKNKNFPSNTKKILFNDNINVQNKKILNLFSWSEITNYIHGKLTNKEIANLLSFFSSIKFNKIRNVYNKGNSTIYKGFDNNKNIFAIKFYPDILTDSRKRLKNEFNVLKKLRNKNIKNIPKAISKSELLNIGIYEWINGKPILKINKKDILYFINFIKKLKKLSDKEKDIRIDFASESCLSGKNLIDQIDERIKKFEKIYNYNKKLKAFLSKVYMPLWKKIKNKCYNQWPQSSRNNALKKNKLILSPSDFGFHNSLKKNDNIYFLDFEYFGWDDPVKLTADFIWHPSRIIDNDILKIWKKSMINIFSDDKDFRKRLKVSMPLYGMRWVMIILNDFLPDYERRRKNARNYNLYSERNLQNVQLNKAIKYCNVINKLFTKNLKNKLNQD